MGGWLRGVLCGASIVVLAWHSAALVLRAAWPELDASAAVEETGAGRGVAQSAGGTRARPSFAPIFGTEASGTPVKRAPVARNAAYSLRGLFEASDGRGIALIESLGATAVYREQDRLPGGEAVAEIGADSVTLSGASGLTLIAFEPSVVAGVERVGEPGPMTADRAPEAADDDAAPVYEAPADIRPEQRRPISLATLKKHVLSPEAMAATRVARVSDGAGKFGLRIQSLPLDDLTKAIGVRRGDIILAVNGVSMESMDSPATVRTLLETLPARSEVVVDLVRRDALHRLVIPLSHG